MRKLFLILAGILVLAIVVLGIVIFFGTQVEPPLIDRSLDKCQQDTDCVPAIDISRPCNCPAAYSLVRLKKDPDLISYESGKDYSDLIKNKDSQIVCQPCLYIPQPIAVCSKENFCQMGGNSCAKDSDCPQGLVCVGRGPTQPSKEIPGVCVTNKQSQTIQ